MKNLMIMSLVSMIASAQVVVKESVKDNSVTGVKVVTVVLSVRGDKPYSDDRSGEPAELGIVCQQTSRGKYHKSDVTLTLSTGVVAENRSYFGIQDPLSASGIILTAIRFDEEKNPRSLAWQRTDEYPDILILNNFKFIRDHIFNSKLVHIEVTGSGAGTNVSSFDLSGLKEEYAKHQECKQ